MTLDFERSARPERVPSVAWRIVAEEAVMVLPSTARVHTLNPAATRFWELADGSRTIGDIVGSMSDEFDETSEKIDADCQIFVAELIERQLITLS